MNKFTQTLFGIITMTLTACSGGGSSEHAQLNQMQKINQNTMESTSYTDVTEQNDPATTENNSSSSQLEVVAKLEDNNSDKNDLAVTVEQEDNGTASEENGNTEIVVKNENTETTVKNENAETVVKNEDTEVVIKNDVPTSSTEQENPKTEEKPIALSFSGIKIDNSPAKQESAIEGNTLTLTTARTVGENNRPDNISRSFDLTQTEELRQQGKQAPESAHTIVIEDNNLILHLYTGKLQDNEAVASYIAATNTLDESTGLTDEDILNGKHLPQINEYTQGGNDALRAMKDDIAGMNANYSGVFFYANEDKVSKQNHLKLSLQDKKITGKVTDSYSGQKVLFTVDGNIDMLAFKPTNQVDVVGGGISEPRFYHSNNQEKDVKYVSGVVKSDNWQGVYNTKKE